MNLRLFTVFSIVAATTSVVAQSSAFAVTGPAHRESIISILEKDSLTPGRLDVEVVYLAHCGDVFQQVVTQTVPPISLSNPHIAVEVLATNVRLCLAADQKQVATFQVPRIVGAYTFIPVQPNF
jgi:hypothetical protein